MGFAFSFSCRIKKREMYKKGNRIMLGTATARHSHNAMMHLTEQSSLKGRFGQDAAKYIVAG